MIPILAAVAAATTAATALPARAELYTMGVGDDVFEAFGHSALCIIDEQFPDGACYNYGTTDFSDPVQLVWDVLRGRARFWVSRMPLPLMLQAYTEDDRTVYRQKLDLSPEAAATLAQRLEDDMRPERRTYVYNHYHDNCATRLRDHLNAVTGGRLRAGNDRPFTESYRRLTMDGFSSSIWLLVGMDVLVGRQVDRRPTVWEAMFLPAVLRAQVARRLHAPPDVFYTRRGPVPTLSPLAGRHVLWVAALSLSVLCAAASLSRRRGLFRLALVATGLVLGLLALVVDGAAAVALLPELRRNEVLLVLLPTDLALAFLSGRVLLAYLVARLTLAAVVAVALIAGILLQPMWAVWTLAAGPLLACLLGALRRPQTADLRLQTSDT